MESGDDRRTPLWNQMNGSAAVILAAAFAIAIAACGSAPTPAPAARTASATPASRETTVPGPSEIAAPSPTVRATASPSPTASPLAIGDPCLVGRWTMTSLVMTDSTSLQGVTITFTGQVGTVATLTADGMEIFDLNNSTRVTGSGGGHTMSWLGRGVQRFAFHGEGGQWWESGPPQTATATLVVVDGVSQPDFTSLAPPVSGSYTCSGSDLTIVVITPYPLTEKFKKIG